MSLESAGEEIDSVDALQLNDDRQMLVAALATLPLEQRLVLEFSYFLDHSCEEIAEIMECPVNTVKTRMFHARRKLRVLLGASGNIGPGAQR
jgi:RNA polymerase sigma-70 factor (ECF subfamily)